MMLRTIGGRRHGPFVMAGLDPAIHVFDAPSNKDVDARHKAGHDDETSERVMRARAPYSSR
jgi:hypothetical protein